MASERDEDKYGGTRGSRTSAAAQADEGTGATGRTGGDGGPETGRGAGTGGPARPGPGGGAGDGAGGGEEPKAATAGGTDASGADAKVAAAIAAAEAAGPKNGENVRVDSWIWAVRLVKTRSSGAAACRGGHVRVNGERVKPAYSVRVGDEVRVRQEGRERVVVVTRLIRKRVGAPVAAQCYIDNSPPPPPREAVAPAGIRDRGAGRPTKRERRELERLRGLRGPGGRPEGR
ncbi:RNA-binding S4 domain-containing protein [Streptomyces sp. NPDC052020]|uniref:RNA-binding S4 domain-containing protein n=1 Tax=Streptomyces sp. NPDC052020 TaxID=3155677 RepID=UPI003415DDE8